MDDIGVSNDNMTAGFFLRRPSRADRAVDDPIREIEGILVNEYGRCVIFLFLPFFSFSLFLSFLLIGSSHLVFFFFLSIMSSYS